MSFARQVDARIRHAHSGKPRDDRPARLLGIDADIGSIAVGKLADLMVLNANPLENIRSTADIRYVMKAGTLYDANSLDELWPKQKPYGNNYWFIPEMFTRGVKRVDGFDRR